MYEFSLPVFTTDWYALLAVLYNSSNKFINKSLQTTVVLPGLLLDKYITITNLVI